MGPNNGSSIKKKKTVFNFEIVLSSVGYLEADCYRFTLLHVLTYCKIRRAQDC